jgi:hypothetical protein
MSDLDEDRVRAKAHDLWESEGRPEGRAERHWVEAREIVALEDSAGSTLQQLDETTGETVEPLIAVQSHGDVPELTDLGEDRRGPSWQAAKAGSGTPGQAEEAGIPSGEEKSNVRR